MNSMGINTEFACELSRNGTSEALICLHRMFFIAPLIYRIRKPASCSGITDTRTADGPRTEFSAIAFFLTGRQLTGQDKLPLQALNDGTGSGLYS